METDPGQEYRWVPVATMLGAFIVLLGTLLHPVTVNPADADIPIHFILIKPRQWMWDHGIMAVGLLLWLGGLASCFRIFAAHRSFSIIAAALFAASIAIWLVTLAFELGGMPIASTALRLHAAPGVRSLAASLFAGTLIAGYFAMVLVWLGVMLAADSKWGRGAGGVGAAGIVYSLLVPNVWILAVTSAIPYLWSCVFAWRCFMRSKE